MSSHFCDLPKFHPELGAIWCHQLSDGRREGPKALPHLYVAALDLGECPQPGHVCIRLSLPLRILSSLPSPCCCMYVHFSADPSCLCRAGFQNHSLSRAIQTGSVCSQRFCDHYLRVCSSWVGIAHRSGSHAGIADLSGWLPDVAVSEGGCCAAPNHTAELSEDDSCLLG